MTEQKIYLICEPCPDAYYSGHPTNLAFTTREAAQKHLKDNNLYDEDDEHNCSYYVQEVTLYNY